MKKFLKYEFVNRAFAFFCFAAAPGLGSAVSFAWHGGALWCVFEILSGRRKFSRDHDMLVMTLLTFLYCVLNAVPTLWHHSTYGEADQMLRLVTLLLFPFSYSIWAISDKAALMRTVILASMVACYSGLAIAMVQTHGFGYRAAGGAGNAIVFAFAISMAGSISLAGLFSQENRLVLPLAGAFVASWLALFYSGTRFLWITTLPVDLMVLWIYRRQLSRFISPRILALVVLGLALGFGASIKGIQNRLQGLSSDWTKASLNDNYGTSVGARLSLLEMAPEYIIQHPFGGHGLGATRKLIETGFKEKHGLDFSFSHFHNGYLTTAVESGVLGLVSLLAIFVAAIANALRAIRNSLDPVEIFGGAMLLILTGTYGIGALANKVLGHDIQDTVFIIFLIMGTYLASGTSRLTDNDRVAAA